MYTIPTPYVSSGSAIKFKLLLALPKVKKFVSYCSYTCLAKLNDYLTIPFSCSSVLAEIVHFLCSLSFQAKSPSTVSEYNGFCKGLQLLPAVLSGRRTEKSSAYLYCQII